MNNEEKILELLTQMQKDIADLKQGQIKLEQGQAELRADVATLKEDVAMIKEDTQITREATNTLLEWAEQAQVEVKIPLYKKAE